MIPKEAWLEEAASAHRVREGLMEDLNHGRKKAAAVVELVNYWNDKVNEAMGEFLAACSV